MKILHLSDLHYAGKTLHRVKTAMQSVLDAPEAMQAHLCIISGDLFDAPLSAHSDAFLGVLSAIAEIAEAMPVHIIYGTASHDHPGSLDALKTIGELTMHPITVSAAPDTRKIYYPGMPSPICTIHSLPGLNRAAPGNRDIRAIIDDFAESPKHPEVSRILVAHGSVAGSITESGFAIVSVDHEFTIDDLAAADCDAVMLGHIHQHQSWLEERPTGQRVTIAYPGSLTRLTYGQSEPPGYLIWDVSPGRATFVRHETPAPNLLHIETSGPPDMTVLAEAAATAAPGDMIRIRYSVDAEFAHEIQKDRIREMFAGFEMKLEATINPVQSVRASTINLAPTITGKLKQWAETTSDTARLDELIERVELVSAFDADEIIRRLS